MRKSKWANLNRMWWTEESSVQIKMLAILHGYMVVWTVLDLGKWELKVDDSQTSSNAEPPFECTLKAICFCRISCRCHERIILYMCWNGTTDSLYYSSRQALFYSKIDLDFGQSNAKQSFDFHSAWLAKMPTTTKTLHSLTLVKWLDTYHSWSRLYLWHLINVSQTTWTVDWHSLLRSQVNRLMEQSERPATELGWSVALLGHCVRHWPSARMSVCVCFISLGRISMTNNPSHLILHVICCESMALLSSSRHSRTKVAFPFVFNWRKL